MELIKRVVANQYVKGYIAKGTFNEDGFNGEKYIGSLDIVDLLKANPYAISNAKLKKNTCWTPQNDLYDIAGNGKGVSLTKLPTIRINPKRLDTTNCHNCSGEFFLRSRCWECLKMQ